MKPDWNDAPEWANWLAMDYSDSEWVWHECKPEQDSSGDWHSSGDQLYANTRGYERLERRP